MKNLILFYGSDIWSYKFENEKDQKDMILWYIQICYPKR